MNAHSARDISSVLVLWHFATEQPRHSRLVHREQTWYGFTHCFLHSFHYLELGSKHMRPRKPSHGFRGLILFLRGTDGWRTTRTKQTATTFHSTTTTNNQNRRYRGHWQSDRGTSKCTFSGAPRKSASGLGPYCRQDAKIFHQNHSGRYGHGATISLRS